MNVYKNAYPDLEKAVQLEKEQKLWSDLTKFEEIVADLFKWWRNSGGEEGLLKWWRNSGSGSYQWLRFLVNEGTSTKDKFLNNQKKFFFNNSVSIKTQFKIEILGPLMNPPEKKTWPAIIF